MPWTTRRASSSSTEPAWVGAFAAATAGSTTASPSGNAPYGGGGRRTGGTRARRHGPEPGLRRVDREGEDVGDAFHPHELGVEARHLGGVDEQQRELAVAADAFIGQDGVGEGDPLLDVELDVG